MNRASLLVLTPAHSCALPVACTVFKRNYHFSLSRSYYPIMSSESSCFPSGYSHVPVLATGNFLEWQTAIEKYLTFCDHVRVIRRTKSSTGALVDPSPPSDPDDLKKWNQSEQIARGVIMITAVDLHLELVHKYEDGSAWELWKAIEACHVQQDAFLYHQAWVHLFSLRKRPDERYMDYYRRVDDARSQIDRVKPPSLTPEQLLDELLLFTLLTGLPSDDPLRPLISQANVNLDDLYAAFLRTDVRTRNRRD